MTPAARRRAQSTTATLAQVKALADPMRYRVFENLLAEARTAKQMAEHLGTHPTRLYHHFRVLERAGLIRPAGTRQKRGTTEKYFKAAVDRIEISRSAGDTTPLAAALLEGVLGSTLADIQRAGVRSGGVPAARAAGSLVKRYRVRATPAQAAEIKARLAALAEVCETLSAPDDAQEFGLTLAFYPTPDTRTRRRRR
jgi:DNA-binding transcriptional ArsR family regulator